MSAILHLRHPVCDFHVPRRGRHARVGLRMELTPVEVEEIAASDAQPVLRPEGRDGIDHYLGSHWHVMPAESLDALESLDILQVAMAGGRPFAPNNRLGAFVRSPLLCVASYGIGDARASCKAGGAKVICDGEAQAVDDLHAWAKANLRLREGMLMVRMRGPLARLDIEGDKPTFRLSPDGWWDAAGTQVVAVSRLKPHWDFQRAMGVPLPDEYERNVAPSLERLTFIDTSDDLSLFVNDAAMALLASALRLGAQLASDGTQPPADLAEMIAALRPGCLRGMLGGIPDDETQDAARFVAADAAVLDGWWEGLAGMGSPQLKGIRDYARDVVLPALDREHEPEDSMAFEGMAP